MLVKRDLEVIRHILITIENSTKYRLITADFTTEKYNSQIISHHILLLLDCDYIEITEVPMCRPGYTPLIVNRITSQGYDYLDNIRDDTIWNETKKQISKVSSSVSLDVIKSVAGKIILGMIGI